MKKTHCLVVLLTIMTFIITGSFSLISAASVAKKKNDVSKLIKIEGKITENEHGNANGLVTIKTGEKDVTLFYAFGKFEITGAKYFDKDDTVAATYKPVKADYDGELISIKVKNKK